MGLLRCAMAELTCFLHVLCLGVLELLHLMMPLCWGVVPWALVCPRASRGAASNPSLLELSCRESSHVLPEMSELASVSGSFSLLPSTLGAEQANPSEAGLPRVLLSVQP